MHKHGYGSQGMGNWDEMDDEEVGDDFGRPAHTRPQRPTGESIMNSIMWDHTDDTDDMEDDESVGWKGAAIKYGPGAINAVNTWGPAIKHCISSMCRL